MPPSPQSAGWVGAGPCPAGPGESGGPSLSRGTFLSAAAVLPFAALSAIGGGRPFSTTSATAASATFLKRSGSTLTYGDAPFSFTGYNIYEACSDGSATNGCGGDLYDGNALTQALATLGVPARAGSGRVVRCWFFQRYSVVAGTRDWSRFDHAVRVARNAGYLLVPVLANNWGDCEGADSASSSWNCSDGFCRSTSWYQNGYRSTVEPSMTATYRAFVLEVVTRYRNEPAIAFWQLMNEPACGTGSDGTPGVRILRRFADDMGAAVKKVDRNHLLSFGSIGSGQPGMANADYTTVHASPHIDLCEIHDYSNVGVGWYGDQWNGVATRIAQARSLGKPLFVGEFGTQTSPGDDQPPNPPTLTARAHLYDDKLATYFGSGLVGALVWDIAANPTGGTAHNDLAADDPAVAYLRAYGSGAAASAQRRTTPKVAGKAGPTS